MARVILAAAGAIVALAAAACGSAGAVDTDPDMPTSDAMCAPDVPDCNDMIVDDMTGDDADGFDGFDADAAAAEATALLGLAEDELPADVRVGRLDDEHMALTEDYVVGRHTAELDTDDAGVPRVTSVVTELPEGPVTTR